MKIYVVVGDRAPVAIETVKTITRAEALIARYEREDRYEIEVEKYKMPAAWCGEYPRYYYGK